MRTMWHWLTATVLVVLVVISAAAVTVRLNHGRFLSVQSGSMMPALHRGDLVVVTNVPDNSIQVGDVITFTSPINKGLVLSHRVIATPQEIGSDLYQTKGDANSIPDEPIHATAIIGKVNYMVPKLGYVSDFLHRPLGLVLIIYLPALIILSGELRRLAAYYRERREYLVPGFDPEHKTPIHHFHLHLKHAKFTVLAMIMVPVLLTIPAHAALQSSAVMRGITIRTVANMVVEHPLIVRVALRCSRDNTATAVQRLYIILYNPTKQTIKLNGWQLKDNSGAFMTFANKKLVPGQVVIINVLLPTGGLRGLQYAGDHLSLVTAAGQDVDGLSWGTDTTELNPSLQNITAGTRIERINRKVDTNTEADWRVRDFRCFDEQKQGEANDTTDQDLPFMQDAPAVDEPSVVPQ